MDAKNSLPENTPLTVKRLKHRADFLRARNGARSHERAFVLQLCERSSSQSDSTIGKDVLRVGFTVTKKVGNAVVRNRIKRRLREAVKAARIPPSSGGKDAVLIARREALDLPFDDLVCAISHGLTSAKQSKHKHNVAIQAPAGQKRRGGGKANRHDD